MKALILWTGLIVGAVGAMAVDANPLMDSESSHQPACVKQTVIAGRVKTKLAAKHMPAVANVKVGTDNLDIVWRSDAPVTRNASASSTAAIAASSFTERTFGSRTFTRGNR
jgi:hypothetical protein